MSSQLEIELLVTGNPFLKRTFVSLAAFLAHPSGDRGGHSLVSLTFIPNTSLAKWCLLSVGVCVSGVRGGLTMLSEQLDKGLAGSEPL